MFAALLLPDAESGELRVTISVQPGRARFPTATGSLVPMHGSIWGKAFRTGKSIRSIASNRSANDPETLGTMRARLFINA